MPVAATKKGASAVLDTVSLILGTVCLLLGLLIILGQIRDRSVYSLKTPAKIVNVDRDPHSHWRGSFRHYPVLSYTVEGKVYSSKAKQNPTRIKGKYSVGQELIIRCDPRRPESFRLGAYVSLYVMGGVLLVLGLTLTVCYFL